MARTFVYDNREFPDPDPGMTVDMVKASLADFYAVYNGEGHSSKATRAITAMHHLRLWALLQEQVRKRGYKGAALVLRIDRRTVASSTLLHVRV